MRSRNKNQIWISPLNYTEQRNISSFHVGISKVSLQSRGYVLYIHIELDSHYDTILCGNNCIIMNYTGKNCDVSPYTNAHEAIKIVPIVQAATAYTNPETGETKILILDESI